MEPDKDTRKRPPDSLEQSDNKESLRQLWWTIAATVIALALISYLYL
jgi:hypothetical protein